MSHRSHASAAPRAASAPRVRNPTTDLRTASVGAPCFARYHKHTTGFLQWLRSQHGPPATFFLRLSLLANRLEAYIQHLWGSNAPRSHASDTVFGLSFFFPLCRDALAGPKRLLKGWEVLDRSSPQSADRLCHLASYNSLLHAGQPRAAVTWRSPRCWVSSATSARRSCVAGVLLSDITWDRSIRNDKIFIGAIALRQTKTGANMEVLLRANHTTTLLREYLAVRTRQPGASANGARLFTFTADHFRTQLQRAFTNMAGSGTPAVYAALPSPRWRNPRPQPRPQHAGNSRSRPMGPAQVLPAICSNLVVARHPNEVTGPHRRSPPQASTRRQRHDRRLRRVLHIGRHTRGSVSFVLL
jgi:hypothetical protein